MVSFMNNLLLLNKQRQKSGFLFREGPTWETDLIYSYLININWCLLANGIKIMIKYSENYISEYYYIACSRTQWVSRRQREFLLGMINFAMSGHVHLNIQFQPLLKATSLISAQERELLTQFPKQLHQALKPHKSTSIWSTIIHFATKFKDMNGCVINWLWRNSRRSEVQKVLEPIRVLEPIKKELSHRCIGPD